MLYYIFFIYVFALIILVSIRNTKSNKIKGSSTYKELNLKIEKFISEFEKAKSGYFTNSIKVKIINEYKDIYKLTRTNKYKKLNNVNINKFNEIYRNLDKLVREYNKTYINKELLEHKDLLDNIDGKSLDKQQREAVVVDEDNNLVLAGAGSGKTLTISGKVKYLVDAKNIKAEEILLISFTKKAAEEMNERISQKLGLNVESKTFHKLGLDIINEKRKKSPDISDSLNKVINNYFKEAVYKDKANLNNLMGFYGCYIDIPKDLDDFENLGEYYKHFNSSNFTTIKGKLELQNINKAEEQKLKIDKKTINGEQVKSIEEVIIANYLYLNGVKYIYEYQYPYDIEDNYRKIYRPDFYLPDYDVYIEHFGVNKDYNAPWLSEIEEQKYVEGIQWKRELHKENKTRLIETYSYYNSEGRLLSELEQKLSKLGIEFKSVDCEDIYNTIIKNEEDKYFKEFRKLIATFIGLFKSRGYTLKNFDDLLLKAKQIKSPYLKERSILFLNIIKPIYVEYQKSLSDNLEIDFNDMIIEATEIVRKDEVKFNYKYIIIDEYQDISQSRFELIKEIKRQTNAKLMCVGDDWQSIYRFTGSDIDLFTNFKKHVGYYELLKIEKTYRNSQQLIDIAGKFVMKNKIQLVKNLKSDKQNKVPIRILQYTDDISKGISKAIKDIVKNYGEGSSITILGRNNFDINVLENDVLYKVIKTENDVIIKSKLYPNVSINYLTAHKSKGLEADNVIIINLQNNITGFPNQMTDDPVLDLVLTKSDNFDFAEERRLFYVALTRTKNTSYLVIPESNSSVFCDELIKEFNINVERVDDLNLKERIACPKCIDGKLVKRFGSDKKGFVGCTNYPMCDFTSKSTDILASGIVCSSCGGYMVIRSGVKGKFLGCTNYPHCKNTQRYEDEVYLKDIVS